MPELEQPPLTPRSHRETHLEDELRVILGWRRGGAPVPPPTGPAWLLAVWLGVVRERRGKFQRDTSVRGIQREGDPSGPRFEASVSRVGDLLMIRDAFGPNDITMIGLSDGPSDEEFQSPELRGHARLSRLSFRALRSVARMPRWQRYSEVRRLAAEAALRASGVDTEDADDDESAAAEAPDVNSLTGGVP